MITIRDIVPKYYRKGISKILKTALEFVSNKYPSVQNWDNIDIVFTSGTIRRGSYYPNKRSKKYEDPGMFVAIGPEMIVYNLKSLGIKKNWIKPGFMIATTCVLIHEFTHHAQHELGMNHGELETTKNELEYLKSVSLFDYKEIMGE